MSEELKPCAFCGSSFVAHGQFSGKVMRVECIDCGASGPHVRVPDSASIVGLIRPFIDEARAAWNRRHQEQDQSSSEYERLLSK